MALLRFDPLRAISGHTWVMYSSWRFVLSQVPLRAFDTVSTCKNCWQSMATSKLRESFLFDLQVKQFERVEEDPSSKQSAPRLNDAKELFEWIQDRHSASDARPPSLSDPLARPMHALLEHPGVSHELRTRPGLNL